MTNPKSNTAIEVLDGVVSDLDCIAAIMTSLGSGQVSAGIEVEGGPVQFLGQSLEAVSDRLGQIRAELERP